MKTLNLLMKVNYLSKVIVILFLILSVNRAKCQIILKLTPDSMNFIGTAESQDISFKANNIENLKIKSDGTIEVRQDLRIGSSLMFGKVDEPSIGIIDSTDLVFKSGETEAARINSTGEFQINRIVTNRIVSPDSMVNVGDNTLHLWHVAQSIYGSPDNTQIPNNGTGIANKGTGIGFRTTPQGKWSLSLGHDVITRGENGFGFGYKLRTDAQVTNAMIIGTGFVSSPYNSDNFVNDIENSLMIGYNSVKPTLFVSPNTSTNKSLTGAVGINTTYIPTGYKLAVDGKIIAEEVLIKNSGSWPDYVFQENYELLPLDQLKAFVTQNCHLPGISSSEIIKNEGMNTSDMIISLLKHLEELTLHTIRLQEEIDKLKATSSNNQK